MTRARSQPFPGRAAVFVTAVAAALALGCRCSAAQQTDAPAGALQALQAAIRHTVRKVAPTVVCVETVIGPAGECDGEAAGFADSPGPDKVRRGQGCGVIFDPAGYILTNQHVIESAVQVRVMLTDGTHLGAAVVGSDVRSDLAVLKAERGGLPALSLNGGPPLAPGSIVLAFGAPYEYLDDARPTISMGLVSATNRRLAELELQQGPQRDRYYGNLIETTDVIVRPGSSGGPLVDLEGRLVGINTAIFTISGGYEGLGYAIPMDATNLAIIEKLKAGEEIEYGSLGILVAPVPRGEASRLGLQHGLGALVDEVRPGSPAARCGIKPGDVVTNLAGQEVRGPSELIRRAGALAPGTETELIILRSDRAGTADRLRITVVVGRRPAAAGAAE